MAVRARRVCRQPSYQRQGDDAALHRVRDRQVVHRRRHVSLEPPRLERSKKPLPSVDGLRRFANSLKTRTPCEICPELRIEPLPSEDGLRRFAPKKPPPSEASLRQFAESLKTRTAIEEYFLDPAGNAVPVTSVGHIHHPINMHAGKYARLWASFVYRQLLGIHGIGLNAPTVSDGSWLDVTAESLATIEAQPVDGRLMMIPSVD